MPENHSWRPWTNKQIAKLRDGWPTMSAAELQSQLAPDSVDGINRMARKLKLRKRRDWMAIAKAHVPVVLTPALEKISA